MAEHGQDYNIMSGVGQNYTVAVECGSHNEYDGRLGLRISSIFVIGAGSLLGAILPIVAHRSKSMRVPKDAFFVAKYFGSGVIVATAFIHLLAPAAENLGSPCLVGPITDYSWAMGIALMTIFLMFFIELMADRYDVFGGKGHSHDIEKGSVPMGDTGNSGAAHSHIPASQHKIEELPKEQKKDKTHAQLMTPGAHVHVHDVPSTSESSAKSSNEELSKPMSRVSRVDEAIPGRDDDFSYPPGGADHLGHQRTHQTTDDDHFAQQMTGLFILEFGVIFHSIFIGLTLAVAGDDFVVLYIVLVFHQTFEGLGLGSRLATAEWPESKRWAPYALGVAYGISTPLAIAVGLAIRSTLAPGSQTNMIVNGVFDSISAGILIYTGLVELMAHEFMFSQEMRKGSTTRMMVAFGCMCFGAALMALLGKWA